MEKYSHEQFQVTGYKVTIHNPKEEMEVIGNAWQKFQSEKMGDRVKEKAHQSLHVVYFNYVSPQDKENKGYDMLIGFITKEGSVQDGTNATTITVPAQNYRYTTVKGELPSNLVQKWKEINSMPKSELERNFQFDLDMYNVDGTEVTIAVSVAN